MDRLADSPWEVFDAWYREAVAQGDPFPEAMTLATASRDGRPSARIVLYKGTLDGGLAFFTNYESQKGIELAENPRAAALFHWPRLWRQIRVEGSVTRLTDAQCDHYFHSRPRESQLGAWASPQSRSVPSRIVLDEAFEHATRRFEGKQVDRPPYWGGYRLMPELFEFWIGRDHRLHDRFRYDHAGDGAWRQVRLAP
jgi:pyridoxamine 5'-phosphate oxidase